MIKQITFSIILVQVAMTTALATQVFLTEAEQSQKPKPSIAQAPFDDACSKAVWPNIPGQCLERVGPKTQDFKTALASLAPGDGF